MAVKMYSTADCTNTANILVYAQAGYGKTKLGATAPKPIFVSSENGLMSVAEYNLPVLGISTLDDFKDAYKIVKANKYKRKTVVLDSISDIAESALAVLQDEYVDGRKAYGVLIKEMSALIRKFRDLDMNTYVIAKSEMYENASGLQCERPSMPGKKLTADLPFFFDIVMPLRIKEIGNKKKDKRVVRYLQTVPDPTREAKDRSGKLSKYEPADLREIFKKIKR